MARVRQPGLVSAMTEPVRTEKRLRQALQRQGMEGCAQAGRTLAESQWGHAGPSGQHTPANLRSAASSSGKRRQTSTSETPLRNHFPGDLQ